MSDPLRTDPTRPSEPVSEADREAKIEQLLLAGLDHYFSGRYDHAINVWTRALFLDRSHARARAYIERARSALAERQRESEELLHSGVAAFDRGEGTEARRLLQAAMSQGAPSDEALAILDRLDRLEQGTQTPQTPAPRRRARTAALADAPPGSSRGAWVVLALLLLVIVAAGAFGAGAFRSDWRMLLDRPPAPSMNPVVRATNDETALLPRRGETALARAHALASSGRLRDALSTLDLVRPTDAQKADADRLRSEIQKQLIGLASLSPSGTAVDREVPPEP
jgi:tetratricopeptide (TPR) repeat protein